MGEHRVCQLLDNGREWRLLKHHAIDANALPWCILLDDQGVMAHPYEPVVGEVPTVKDIDKIKIEGVDQSEHPGAVAGHAAERPHIAPLGVPGVVLGQRLCDSLAARGVLFDGQERRVDSHCGYRSSGESSASASSHASRPGPSRSRYTCAAANAASASVAKARAILATQSEAADRGSLQAQRLGQNRQSPPQIVWACRPSPSAPAAPPSSFPPGYDGHSSALPRSPA